MTGFGVGSGELAHARVSVEVRTVNARFLGVRVRIPSEWSALEHGIEEQARGKLVRGHAEITVRVESADGDGPRLDREAAATVLRELRALRDDVAPDEPLPFSVLGAMPQLFRSAVPLDQEQVEKIVQAVTTQACDALTEMRRKEGANLSASLGEDLAAIRKATTDVAGRIPDVVAAYRTRLSERVERLTQGSTLQLDPGRLEYEVAQFADRTDVAEEVTRLKSHSDQFEDLLRAGDTPVGRKLDFLVQEMGREVNTIGSKSVDVAITRLVIDMKATLERMREQVQNVL